MAIVKQELMNGKNCTIDVDPLNKYPKVPMARVVDVAGVLIAWAWHAIQADDAIEKMCSFYIYGTYEMKGHSKIENGVYNYPGDPKMYPIVTVASDTASVYIYEHAIVAIVQGDRQYVTRMD